jgi:hypothetical protein
LEDITYDLEEMENLNVTFWFPRIVAEKGDRMRSSEQRVSCGIVSPLSFGQNKDTLILHLEF